MVTVFEQVQAGQYEMTGVSGEAPKPLEGVASGKLLLLITMKVFRVSCFL